MIVVDVKDKNDDELSIPINAITYLKKSYDFKDEISYYVVLKGECLELKKKGYDELKAIMTREKEYEYPKVKRRLRE